MALTGK